MKKGEAWEFTEAWKKKRQKRLYGRLAKGDFEK